MKRVLLSLICTLFCLSVLAQIRVSGRIADAAGNPLPGATVTVYENDRIVSYTIAQGDGHYELKTTKGVTSLDYYLMGYRRVTLRVDMKGASTLVKDVILEESNFQLPSITVKPVAVKVAGDTVTYDATAFVRKEDNTLQEVLNRLPHVSVASTGQVKVQGVNVNKVYIEDMDLLGARYGLAIKNIRPADISAVSVYYEHQPIKALEGIEKSNQAALNIKLKEKAKNRWVWTLGALAGIPSLYQGKVSAMNFGSGRQTMAIAKTDNSGEDIITETRMQNLKPGGYKLSDLQGGGMDDLFSTGAVMLPVPQNYYYNNRSNALSVNNLNKLSQNATLKENVVLFTDIRRDDVFTQSVVMPGDQPAIVISDSMMRKRTDKQLEAELTYTSNSRERYLENVFSVKAHFNEAGAVRSSSSGGYVQDYSLPKFIFEDKLSVVGKRGGKVRKFNADMHYSRQNQSMEVVSDNISSLFGTDRVVQEFHTDNLRSNLYTSVVRKVGKGSFKFTPGLKAEYNSYESEVLPQADSMYNNLHLFSFQPYADFSYYMKYRGMKIDIAVPLALRWDFIGDGAKMHFMYSPAVSLEHQLSNTLTLRSSANIGNKVGGVGTMGKGYIYTGYRNLYRYDAVPERVSQNYSLMLSHSNFRRMLFTSVNVNYGEYYSSVAQDELYLQDYTLVTYIDEGVGNRNLSVRGSVKKLFGNVFSFRCGFEYSRNWQEQYLQGEFYRYGTEGLKGEADMEFTPDDKFSLVCSGSYSHSLFKSASSRGIDHATAKITANWYPVRKLLLKGEMYNYWQKSNDSRYKDISLPFLDFRMEYELGKKTRLYAVLRNVLDTREYNYTYFSGASTISRITKLRGAEYLIGLNVSL